MEIPGGLMLHSNIQARKNREIPLMSHTEGTGETPKGFFTQNESLRNLGESNEVNKFERYGCISHRTWERTLNDKPSKINPQRNKNK